MTILRAACFSDIGKVRKENEDRISIRRVRACCSASPTGGRAARRGRGRPGDGRRRLQGGPALAPEGDIDLRAIVIRANESVVSLGMRISPGLGNRLDAHGGLRSPQPPEAGARRGFQGLLVEERGFYLPDRGPFGRERGQAPQGPGRGRLLQRVPARRADPLHRPGARPRGGPERPAAFGGRPLHLLHRRNHADALGEGTQGDRGRASTSPRRSRGPGRTRLSSAAGPTTRPPSCSLSTPSEAPADRSGHEGVEAQLVARRRHRAVARRDHRVRGTAAKHPAQVGAELRWQW
jgi:hypothetical protein